MIRLQFLLPAILATLSFLSDQATATSAPPEKTAQIINRSINNSNQITTRLSKNMYRQEQVQVPYTVQVPYQTEEHYTVSVPYTVQVPYTDYVTEYRDEYRCEDVTRYRDEQRCENVTDYRRECRNEQKCYLIPGSPGECRDVTECGTNAHGQQICKTRRVCDSAGSPTQRCENQQTCENIPYTRRECRNVQIPYTDRECGHVSVPYQREVTRYRDEVRYREETRTRTVTKYREETKCCKTETQSVFDRQLQYQVVIRFPQEAQLESHETESLKVSLVATNPARVEISLISPLYGYKILSQSATGEIINVELGLTELYNLTNAGQSSLKDVAIIYSPILQKFVVSYIDEIVHPKVLTSSQIEVRDLDSDVLIEKGSATKLSNGKIGFILQANLPSTSRLRALIFTTRSGSVISNNQINFNNTAVYEKRTLNTEDIQILSDSSKVQLTAQNQQGLNTMLKLSDMTEQLLEVTTTYIIRLFESKNGVFRNINNPVTVTREQVNAVHGEVTLAKLLGSKASSIIKPGKVIRIQIDVNRKISNPNFQQPIPFNINQDITL